MSKPIVTGLLSYGMSGEVFHAPLLAAHPGFIMKTIVQRSSSSALEHYPQTNIVRSVQAVLDDPEIELVIVNTINSTHFDFAARALAAGKHVVVEKPFTNTVDEARALIDMAKDAGKTLTVFQSRRWDGAYHTLQKIINSGQLGRLVEFEAHYDRFRNYLTPNSWKEETGPGSGILYNLGSHMIDQVLRLFGKPSSLSAKTGVQRTGGRVDDYYDIRMDYPGINVIIKSSYLVREPGPLYKLHGEKGSFIKFGIDPQEEALKLHQVPGGPGWGSEPENYWGILNTEINGVHFRGPVETLRGNYLGYYQNLYEAIREGAEIAVKPEEALMVIEIIEAAQKSSREKCVIHF